MKSRGCSGELMEKVIRKGDEILKVFSSFLVDLSSPSIISYLWNFGSLLGIYLAVQIFTGLFLSIHFSGDTDISFYSVIHIIRDVERGWFIRVLHSNGARMFFIFMYFHIGRGLYYGSYRLGKTWVRGVTILLLSIATAFLGYVLPWGQMSFWAATVITNLLSAIPYIGVILVEWVWGGFAVGNPTLTRFFAFHFILPFLILLVVIFHLVFLHEIGSGNSLGLNRNLDKIPFHESFSVKDILGVIWAFFLLVIISLLAPYIFMDRENFIISNPLVTPTHIQPEWYFLFAYTILRSISRKIGGVMALVFSVMILYFFPFLYKGKFRSSGQYILGRFIFWVIVSNWVLLTWIGAREVESPFREYGGIFSFIYFTNFFILWVLFKVQDFLLE